MPLGWVKKEGNEEEEKQKIEIKPEDIQSAVKPLLEEQNKKFDTISAYIAKQEKKDKDIEDARVAEENRKKNADRNANLTDPTNWLDNPAGMTAEMIKPLVESQQRTNAQLAKRDVLDKMEYYDDPIFRTSVDQLIAAQPLQNQSDPALIMNAYKSVFFDKQQDIKDGKIKSQLSVNSGGRGTSGSSKEEDDKSKGTMSEAEKVYASKLGIPVDKWIKNRNEMEFV